MAIRIDATGDDLSRSANLPANTSFTIMFDTVIVSNLGALVVQPLVWALDAGNTDGFSLFWSTDGVSSTMQINAYDAGVSSSFANFASRPAVGAPFTAYIKCSGTGANLIEAGWRYPHTSWVTATATMAATVAQVTNLWFGGVLATYYADKRIQNVKIWDRALSAPEIFDESESDGILLPRGLNLYCPLPYAGDVFDRGPRRRNLTKGGTLTTEFIAYDRKTRPTRRVLASAATAYTMAASAGSFTLTGNSTGLLFGRRVTTSVGAFTLSGKTAALSKGYPMAAAVGSFSLTGNAANLLFGRRLTAAVGAFSMSGQAANLLFGRRIAAGLATFTLTGVDVTLTHGSAGAYSMPAGTGSFTLTGNATGLLWGHKIAAAVGSFTLSGNTAGLLYGRRLAATVGSFTLTGQTSNLLRGRVMPAAVASFTFTGNATGLYFGHRITPAVGTFTLTGQNVTLRYGVGVTLFADPGAFTLTGSAVSFVHVVPVFSDNPQQFTASPQTKRLGSESADPGERRIGSDSASPTERRIGDSTP